MRDPARNAAAAVGGVDNGAIAEARLLVLRTAWIKGTEDRPARLPYIYPEANACGGFNCREQQFLPRNEWLNNCFIGPLLCSCTEPWSVFARAETAQATGPSDRPRRDHRSTPGSRPTISSSSSQHSNLGYRHTHRRLVPAVAGPV